MTRFITVAVIASLMSTLAVAQTSAAGAARHPFQSVCEAIDSVDFSHMQAMIGGGAGGTYRVTWVEDHFAVCEGEPGIAMGTGTIVSDSILHVDIVLWCPNRGEAILGEVLLTYHDATDTLSGGHALGPWTRVGGGPG